MVAAINSSYVRFLKSENVWPDRFNVDKAESDNDELMENPNRPHIMAESSSSSSNEED